MRLQVEVYGAIALTLLLTTGSGLYIGLIKQAETVLTELNNYASDEASRSSEKLFFRLHGDTVIIGSSAYTIIRDIIVYNSTSIVYEDHSVDIAIEPGSSINYTLPGSVADSLVNNRAILGVFTERGNFITWSPAEAEYMSQEVFTGFRKTSIYVVNISTSSPHEALLVNYTGSGILVELVVYTYSSRINITRILVDGIQVNNIPILVGSTGSMVPAQFSTLPLAFHMVFTRSIEIYGITYIFGMIEVIIIVAHP
ncbi:hypothetical protein [Desulfurococcus amylolyticus]|uniref:Uncharacterized protein n=1 Tax=Desulfurococcus amylolyticus DSM 16532 TaxID=768672 RepID=I3XRY0_DESAM|nr:hypothetical protein [Desulfurococcus amylolyticus]AFL66704.1 hypothetical protein Desfe_0813 [Desulfurococcus amylolyticus DSM 16532]